MGKIPPQAKRVFEGVIFSVYQWEQTLYDDKTTTTFEMLKRADTASVLAVQDGKLLLARDSQPHRPTVYTIPGGRVDAGETPEETAQRELVEETGFEAQRWEFLFSTDPSYKIDWTVHYFIAKDLKKVRAPDPGIGEQIELEWVTWEEYLAITKQPDYQDREMVIYLYQQSVQQLEQFRQRLFQPPV